MKKTIILSLIIFSSFISHSQCNCYTVEDIYIPENAINIVRVVFKNTCDNNVYLRSWLYNSQNEIIASFDECACGVIFPLNQNVSIDFQTNLTSLPSLNTLRVKLSNGTLDCNSVTFAQSLSTINNSIYKDNFKIYPNPTVTNLNIEVESNFMFPLHFELNTILGQNLIDESLFSTSNQIDLSNYKKGVYIYKLLNSENEIVKIGKIIKE